MENLRGGGQGSVDGGRQAGRSVAGRAARFRRLAALVLLALAVHLVVVDGGGRVAEAQEAALAPGSGRASARYLKVGPARGSLSLAPTVGLALSDFLNTRGRGDVRMVDFAALEDSLPPELVSQFPTVKVESTEKGSETGRSVTLGTPSEVPVRLSAAELHAEAGEEPYGRSVFRTAPVDLAVVSVGGGFAEAFSGVIDGRTREAVGRVRIGTVDVGGGALVLEGLEWVAVHRSGADSTQTGSFSVGAITVAGQRFRAPEGAEQPLGDAIAAAEPALRALGVDVQLPAARIEGGIVEMTPLRLRLANSELGPVVAPGLEAVQPAREELVGAIRQGSEDVDAAILLTDVALGVLAGGSRLDIEIGGATAQTAEPAARFSFGSTGGFDLSAGLPPAPAPSVSLPRSSAGSATDGRLPVPSSGAGVAASAPSSSGGELEEALPVSSPEPGAGGAGPLLPIGLAATAAALAAGIVDYRRLLRRPVRA